MLIEFRVENHRSLRDEQVFTMEASRVGDEDDRRPRIVPGYSKKLLTVGALYGANASGKSNLLAALEFMREAVSDSQRSWTPDGGVPHDPFAFGPKKIEPSLFEVSFIVDSVRYEYGFVASDERFLEEWLYAWPLGKKQVWFARDLDSFKFGDHLRGDNKVIEEVTRGNALFLSAAVQLRHEQLLPIFRWFRRILLLRVPSRRFPIPARLPTELALEQMLQGVTDDDAKGHGAQPKSSHDRESMESRLRQFRGLLSDADVGIIDLRVDKSDSAHPARRRYRGIQLKHQAAFDDAWLPLEEESRGTRMLFDIGLPILDALESSGVVVVDELESSLHPILARRLIRLFNDPDTNPKNAQLIFTTHDTNLLGNVVGEPELRRDQVWFTEKNPEGVTELRALSDYKPRKAENLERGYLQGRFGAIPVLGSFFTSED
jgi:AAA15 family ATPase/GTPase